MRPGPIVAERVHVRDSGKGVAILRGSHRLLHPSLSLAADAALGKIQRYGLLLNYSVRVRASPQKRQQQALALIRRDVQDICTVLLGVAVIRLVHPRCA